MKEYTSKDEIYQDYQVAIRLILQGGISPRDYDELPLLATNDRLRVQKYSNEVKNFRSHYPTSVGLFFEIPMKGDTGEVYNTKLVVLGHETGAEIFLPLLQFTAAGVALWAGTKIGEKLFDKTLDIAFEKTLSLLKRELYGGHRIDRIEIRTAEKGVFVMPFSAFKMDQIHCLAKKFQEIQTLEEVKNICFADAANVISFRKSLSQYE